MNQDVVVRPFADEDDHQGVRSLIEVCYGENAVSEEAFRQQHLLLPADAVQGMMVAEAQGRIVGMQPMEIMPHRLEGRALTAGILTGAMVHPDWRRRGVFTRLVQACEDHAWARGAALVWTMPNDRSLPGFLKKGYINPGERRLAVWSPRPTALARKKLPPVLARMAGAVTGTWFSKRSWPTSSHRISERPEAWASLSSVSQGALGEWTGLVQTRSTEWLSWRFGPNPQAYRLLLTDDDTGAVRGWAVVRHEEREGLRVGYLMDVFGLDPQTTYAVGGAALEALAESGVDLVMSVRAGTYQRAIHRGLGMREVPLWATPKHFYTVFTPRPDTDASLMQTLSSIDGWYQSFADWDNI